MHKLICWRRTIDQNDYLFLANCSSIASAKRLAREHGITGPKESELIGMTAGDPELADVVVEPDRLYVADEEVLPIRFALAAPPR